MELAVVTQIPPASWRAETDEAIATALDVLAKQADEAKRAR